ncbi:MAG: hypothetical protein ABSA97_01450 [Verrucomicrobiia bacterium]
MRKGIVCSFVLYVSCTSVLWASGTFTNLDFESATLVPISGDPHNGVYLSEALPGWNGFSGTNQLDWILYDNAFLDSTGIALWSSSGAFPVIQGNYTLSLEAGLQLGSSSISADASLSQTGLVPVGTKSLSFLANAFGPFAVSLGGSSLNLVSSPVTGQNYSLYEADISSFAGQAAELTFTVFAQNPYEGQLHGLTLDSIEFSPDPIPEPSGLSLLVIGVAALGLWRLTYRRAA